MSGHSKWATIKRKKAAIDSKRSKIFTKIIREITVAAKDGGANPENNPRLRLAVQSAKAVNMPKENIERAINKGSGKDGTTFTESVYEGYAPGGVALIVECATDNVNRTVANIRSYFTRHSGSFGTSGSVAYLFERKGIFTLKDSGINEDDFTMAMIDAGAEDVEKDEGYYTLTTAVKDFGTVSKKLSEMGINIEEGKLIFVPASYVKPDPPQAEKALQLIETLEEDDDVQNVFSNLELSQTEMEKINL